MDWWDMPVDSGRVQEIFDDTPLPDFLQDPAECLVLQGSQYSSFMPDACVNLPTTPSSICIAPSIDSAVPHDAVFLLKHYSTTVLRSLTPFRHTKTPWHILFIPHTRNCLAALTLGDDMDHASLCAFYGTLAISAFSLGGVSKSHKWLEQGKAYKRQALDLVNLMLKTAYDVPKAAKYKSILMALLTMVQISIICGNREQAECFFLEAEKFIRVKGLNRNKSRKVRLLHHCYVFERMLHESTLVGSANSTHRHHVRQMIESSGAIAYSQDSLSFRLGAWNNLDQEMLRVKGQEEGENDLHLQLPGVWSATLYPEIFGIPEKYVSLLSLAIRLGREKDDASQDNTKPPLGLAEFISRAKAVEKCINQLGWRSEDVGTGDDEKQLTRHSEDNLVDAMQQALAIYFYRRVYDLDARMLQQKVIGVRDCLLRFEGTDAEVGCGSARLVWPAFVAACEAEDSDVRAAFSDWFTGSAQRTGLRFFSDTLADIERIWEEKRSANGILVTWIDLMRNHVPLDSSL
ncbi:Arginine metabolism regulation protein II [Tolypocladium ophioglossoides CBS 100239]|uniref:Arginine metabolism regulation protein II n=1 Tax=Tolypocladium ophioglossoides (strain CBS 100239) TaxID=1163406 RepID=A0A0L0N9M5_TOLOC|nr:Arginine metabolism regulation protein II [Tolypocladium ophioglossoides CBS 100239]